MSPRGRDGHASVDRPPPSDAAASARPRAARSASSSRADDDRRKGAVGLQRGQRLDRLAQPLLVGQKRAARLAAHSARRPTETAPARRRARAAARGRLGRGGAGGADRGGGLGDARRAGRASTSAARPVTSTSWRARKASSSTASHGSSGTARVPSAPGSAPKAAPDVGIPQHLEAQLLALDAARPDQPRRGRPRPASIACRQRSAAASRWAERCARSASATSRVSGAAARRRAHATTSARAWGSGPASVLQHQPAAVIVAPGGDRADPAPAVRGQPRRAPSVRRVSSG